MQANHLTFLPEVADALKADKPVVALESTVITHGLPWPKNIETAQGMEAAVRKGGAIPATIAIVKGEIRIGLTAEELEYLSKLPEGGARKCSRRDLPSVMVAKENGSTTVAATMILAEQAGIKFFATGGIGGVHRGHHFDVSADLMELGQTPVTVICGGVKAILDVPNTLEVLETQGVPVLGYGCDNLPLFYSHQSDYPITQRVDSAADVAKIVQAHHTLGLRNGILVTSPVPKEDEVPAEQIDGIIATAVAEAEAQGVRGAEITPWLLSRIAELSNNQSMIANISLLKNNGYVAGMIATAYQELVNLEEKS
ncbi:MAG: pseudouridine-5'-phosphate glycosidase [Anaerolineae bacterium]